MALPGTDSASQVHLRNGEPEVFPQIRCYRHEVARKLQARVAPLPDHGGVGLGIRGFQGKLLAIDSAGGNLFHAHRRIDALQRLCRRDSQFVWIHPAPNLPGVQNVLE